MSPSFGWQVSFYAVSVDQMLVGKMLLDQKAWQRKEHSNEKPNFYYFFVLKKTGVT
jgi:hypothetical protein